MDTGRRPNGMGLQQIRPDIDIRRLHVVRAGLGWSLCLTTRCQSLWMRHSCETVPELGLMATWEVDCTRVGCQQGVLILWDKEMRTATVQFSYRSSLLYCCWRSILLGSTVDKEEGVL